MMTSPPRRRLSWRSTIHSVYRATVELIQHLALGPDIRISRATAELLRLHLAQQDRQSAPTMVVMLDEHGVAPGRSCPAAMVSGKQRPAQAQGMCLRLRTGGPTAAYQQPAPELILELCSIFRSLLDCVVSIASAARQARVSAVSTKACTASCPASSSHSFQFQITETSFTSFLMIKHRPTFSLVLKFNDRHVDDYCSTTFTGFLLDDDIGNHLQPRQGARYILWNDVPESHFKGCPASRRARPLRRDLQSHHSSLYLWRTDEAFRNFPGQRTLQGRHQSLGGGASNALRSTRAARWANDVLLHLQAQAEHPARCRI